MILIKKICILSTNYSLLLVLLVNKKKDLYLIGDETLKLSNNKLDCYIEVKDQSTLKKILKINFLLIKIIILKRTKRIIGNDHTILLWYFISFFSIDVIEDGLSNYEVRKIKKLNFKQQLKKLLGIYKIGYGLDKRVKKIYLTGLAPIPEEIAHKVELINLKELWNKKTLEEQNDILDVFSFDLDIKEKIKGRDIILFTQPLSEDNVITEEDKLKIYSEIIKKYPKDRLVIKTHPREKTNYKDIFKEYLVLDNPFPFEILNLLDVKFNKAITLFSTAALGLGDRVEVDFYGTEVHDKILERFGSCDNIMKRNCFLKEE